MSLSNMDRAIWRWLAAGGSIFSLLGIAQADAQAPAKHPALDPSQVVRAFAAAHDSGSAAGMALAFDTAATVTIADVGLLKHGWKEVRAYLDSLAEPARLYGARFVVDSIKEQHLGPDYALVIASIRDVLKPDEWPGVLTVVLHRTDHGWRVISLHKSTVATEE